MSGSCSHRPLLEFLSRGGVLRKPILEALLVNTVGGVRRLQTIPTLCKDCLLLQG